MIPVAVCMGAVFVYFFIWATKNGQFDDLDTPSMRLLLEDTEINQEENSVDINLKQNRKEL
jgi:cbb3-type cytochrome oxidase maturation protein